MEDKEQEIIDAIEKTDIIEDSDSDILYDIDNVLDGCWYEIKKWIARGDCETEKQYVDDLLEYAMFDIPDVLERNFKYVIKKMLKIKEELENGRKNKQ